MSWQQYIDTLMDSGKVSNAAIFGLDGSIWAASDGLKGATAAEVKKAIGGVSDPSALQSGGVFLNSTKYLFLRVAEDSNAFYFKKGTSGGCLAKGKKCAVVGLYAEPQIAGPCNQETQKICDYLRNCEY